MQLYDKDLLSIQEVRELVSRAKKAQQELSRKSQSDVDRLIKCIAQAGELNARSLAAMACEETGFGIESDKVIKNIFASKGVYEYIRDMKTVGEISRDDKRKVCSYAVPIGVIAALIPSTNPTSTVLYKALIAIKAGNAIVFSPHPNAQRCISETISVIRKAIADAGENEDLVTGISIPTVQATDVLMKHPDISMILATGGAAMVRAAYSSGTPAIGVGPGNAPAYIEASADIPMAVKRIIDSKTFDNGTICASEQSVITDCSLRSVVQAEMEKQGAYFLSRQESEQLGKFILRGDGTMNPRIVGKSVRTIAELAGLSVPNTARVLVAEESGVGRGHPYSNEKLAPILAFYTADGYEKVCERCVEILSYEGAGHSFSIHTENTEIVKYFAERVPASRILVNTPSALGGIGASTGLMPSLTLGCGAIGGSATSENVGPMELLNMRHVAYGLKELEDISGEVKPALSSEGIVADGVNINEIVRRVIEQIYAAQSGR